MLDGMSLFLFFHGVMVNFISVNLCVLLIICSAVCVIGGYFCFTPSRVKMAEECFIQARQKASYTVTPKHASGIVCMASYSVSVAVCSHLFSIYLL